MSPALNARWYPRAVTSTTLTLNFYYRTTEGTGSFLSNAVGMPANTTIIYASGRDGGVPAAAIYEAIVAHFLNGFDPSKWNPESGTPEQRIRAALDDHLGILLSAGGAVTVGLFFDGQFGSVYVG